MTVDLFGVRPRRAPRKLMHVHDAYARQGKQVVVLRCARCGFTSDWTEFDTVTQAKAGLPCPRCSLDRRTHCVQSIPAAESAVTRPGQPGAME